MSEPYIPSAGTLDIVPWDDPVMDALGHDARSHYVEMYWLAILGPSTCWLLRRIASGLEAEPGGFSLDLADTARHLGLGARGGRSSPFVRALGRCVTFDLARVRGRDTLAVRRRVPPLNRRQIKHLPPSLQESHRRWQESHPDPPAAEQLRHRSRQLALSLVRLGEDRGATERQLVRWRFHPALARDAAQWAWASRAPDGAGTPEARPAPAVPTPAARSATPAR